MNKVYIKPDIHTRQCVGGEVMAAVSLEVVESTDNTITSSDQIEANRFSVWEEDEPIDRED